jgi:hypothetical protein
MVTPPWGKNAVELMLSGGKCPCLHLKPHVRNDECRYPFHNCQPCGFRSQSCEGCKSLYSGACFPCCLSSNDGHYYRSIPADLVSPGWCPGREEK